MPTADHFPRGSADPRRGARRIALAYIAAGLLWITGSDRAVEWLAAGTDAYYRIGTLKGYGYVLLTGYLLYLAMARLLQRSRRAEAQLVESERAYRAMFDGNPNPMWVYAREDQRFLAVNDAAVAVYGFSREEFLQMTLRDVLPGDAPEESLRTGPARVGSSRHRTRSGAELCVEISSHDITFNRVPARLVLAQDVSARARMERELQASRSQLTEAQRIAGLGTWSFDPATHAIEWSDTVCELAGVPPNTPFAPERLAELVAPEDWPLLEHAYRNALRGLPMNIEFKLTRPDGDVRFLHLCGELLDADGEASRLLGTVQDITARKQMERRLADSEYQYRQLVELMPDGILLLDSGNRVLFANPAAARLFGALRPAELQGRDCTELLLDGAVPQVPDDTFVRCPLRRCNGEVILAEVAAQPFLRGGERHLQMVVRDISNLQKMQEALQTANERLLRLTGQAFASAENERRLIARELHDDVGQLLTFIKMSTTWLLRRATDAEQVQRIESMHTSAGEALQKVRDLSLLLRPAQLDHQGLAAAIEWQLGHYLQGSGITYRLEGDALDPRPDPDIEIALFRIFQEALTNIVRHSGAGHVDVTLQRTAGEVRLRIVDDGGGFDVEAVQGGASLGLTSMRERAQQLRGLLHIKSVAGVGTELVATLPENADGRRQA